MRTQEDERSGQRRAEVFRQVGPTKIPARVVGMGDEELGSVEFN
jgi:hypothetical protein